MTSIEDRLGDAARQLRQEVGHRVDVDRALHEVERGHQVPPSAARRPSLVAAAVVLVAALASAAVLVSRQDDQGVVADGSPTTTEAPSLPVADGEIPFELLAEAASTDPPGSMVYGGVPDVLADQWTTLVPGRPVPAVDFDEQIVLVLTAAHADGCPEQLVGIRLDGGVVRPTFEVPVGDGACGAAEVARTYIVAIDRADLPQQFHLVADADSQGRGLPVDLDENHTAAVPFEDVGTPVQPDGPDLQAPEPGREISFDGVGDVRVGQALDPSAVMPYEGGGPCGYWGPGEPSHDGDEPLTGLVTGADTGTPTVLDVRVSRNWSYRTASGVGIGTTLATLERIYGDDLVVDRADGWENPTDGLLASYRDVAAVRSGDRALTFILMADVVEGVKVGYADHWGDDEGCA